MIVLPKVTIMQQGMRTRAYIDGKDVADITRSIDISLRPDEVPTVTFDMNFADGMTELCEANALIKVHPETFQEAAKIILHELKTDRAWRNVIERSIYYYLEQERDNDDPMVLAKEITDVLIGDEKRADF